MVNEIYREKCIEDKYVYNIKVEDYHTYFVGNCGIWAHNKYRNINNSLRGLETATPENQTAINNIQAAMNKSQMPKNMILYRGSDIAELGDIGNLSTQDMVGKSFTELAFTSTSTSNQVASGTFSGNLQMRIFAKRGTHALDLSELSHYSGEKEILFGAGQQFTITNANIQNSVLYIDVIAK